MLHSAFQNSQYDITSSTIHMLMDVDDWFAFSNKKSGNAGTLSNSVEAIHDGIHVALGGSMASSEAAGRF
jgi:tyrosinase